MAPKLDLKEFEAAFKAKPGKIVDVRTPGEYDEGHLKNAINLDWLGGMVQNSLDILDKNETYYLYCASGNRSGMATSYLKQQNFRHVYNIGGYATVMHANV
jgi:phage shock protein E